MQPTASPDYYTRLGLEYDPFAVDAMPDFFFVGAQRRFLVQSAVHALYFSGATVLLLGAEGVGKTRTLDEIEKELKDLADICRIDATVLMDAAEIRALLAAELGLPSAVAAGNAELVYALERLRPADDGPQPVLVAIDAAHLLSIETLAECAALVAGAGGRLRLLLAGEADLAISWQQAQAGAAEMLKLAPLDRNETADYVCTKLQAAGYREAQPLSDAQFAQLFTQSSGNFAAINALVPQLLQPAPEASPVARRIKALPLLHIGVIAALLTVLILLVLYRSGGSSNSSQETQSPQSADIQTPSAVEKKGGGEKKNNVEQNTIALQLPVSTAPSATSPAPAEGVVTPPATLAPAPTAVPATVQIENKNQMAEKTPVTEKKEAVEKKEATNKNAVVEKSVAAARNEKHEREKIKTEISDDKAAAAKTQLSTLTADERALLAFPSSQYVLQLIGAESRATIDKFAKGAGKGVKLYLYRTQLHGKPWFIVVTGPYADRNAAQAAQAKLPEAVRQQQPWGRTVANVQADIRAHSGR